MTMGVRFRVAGLVTSEFRPRFPSCSTEMNSALSILSGRFSIPGFHHGRA